MCAIAGLWNLPYDKHILEKMLETMLRRGPDGNGIHSEPEMVLLHSRLAIIDPAGGAQPMHLCWHGREYTISYNGELYNTQELRTELMRLGHTFATHSDTEVVLRAYAQWGKDCVLRFNGIFAFAVWERMEKRLFLARDRIGVKPLYYCLHQKGLLFASEMKTILAYPTVKPQLDGEGAAQLILLGPGHLPGSGVFRGILELEPGYRAVLENGKLKTERYWYLRDREHMDDFPETLQQVRNLVTDAVRRQMVSDVPIGTFLSGGLDSSLISAICAGEMEKRGERLRTFSVDYAENDKYFTPGKFQPNADGEYIRLMQAKLNTIQTYCVLSPEDLVEELENATTARDLPGMADVDFSLLAFCREIRRDVKMALSGECADEIFGGYPWYRDPEIRRQAGFPWAQNTMYRVGLMHPDLQKKISGEEFIMDAYQDTCKNSDILPGNSPQERRMKEMVNLNFRWFMQTLLERKDRMSMFCGLEVRVPFCDYRIAEYLYGVPWEMKNYQNTEKGLLRKAMEGILPEQILWRKKSPYPKTYDPRYEQLVRSRLETLILEKDAPLFALVSREAVGNLLISEPVWPWYGQLMRRPQLIAYLLQLDAWLRRYELEICI